VKKYNGLTPYCGRCLCICPKQADRQLENPEG
jgi:hypothetical protein